MIRKVFPLWDDSKFSKDGKSSKNSPEFSKFCSHSLPLETHPHTPNKTKQNKTKQKTLHILKVAEVQISKGKRKPFWHRHNWNRPSRLALRGFSLNLFSEVIWSCPCFPHLLLLKWKAAEVDKDVMRVII